MSKQAERDRQAIANIDERLFDYLTGKGTYIGLEEFMVSFSRPKTVPGDLQEIQPTRVAAS